MEKGEYRVAMKMLKQIIDNTEIDLEYERLYIARVYLAYAECLSVNGQGQLKKSLHQAYKYYPQLIPFESLAVRMRLRANAMSFAEKKIIGYLHKRNIEWVEANDSSDAIDVLVEFGKQDNYPTIAFECSYQGEKIVNRQIFSYDNPEDAADELALYLFNIGNDAKSFNMNDSKGNLYSLSGSQVLNKDFK